MIPDRLKETPKHPDVAKLAIVKHFRDYCKALINYYGMFLCNSFRIVTWTGNAV